MFMVLVTRYCCVQGAGGLFYFGTVHIGIQLRNDNPPISAKRRQLKIASNSQKQSMLNVLHVVRRGELVLSRRNLHYVDHDKGTLPSDLLYKITDKITPVSDSLANSPDAPSGFYLLDPPSSQGGMGRRRRASAFTQQQIDSGAVLYKDSSPSSKSSANTVVGGSLTSVVNFVVSDGEFKTVDQLQVRASEPFVQIDSNTGAVVAQGLSVVISSANLSVLTNLNVRPENLVFTDIRFPAHGELVLSNAPLTTEAWANFTQRDLDFELLEYRHTSSWTGVEFDSFEFTAVVASAHEALNERWTNNDQQLVARGVFQVRVLPGAYWQKLRVKANKTLLVEEDDDAAYGPDGSAVTNFHQQTLAITGTIITSKHLEVGHAGVSPSDVRYTVTVAPGFGVLRLLDRRQDPVIHVELDARSELQSLTEFDQTAVNTGRLAYIPTQPDGGEDFFVFDVTNGITGENY
jgi:hypothetical protein